MEDEEYQKKPSGGWLLVVFWISVGLSLAFALAIWLTSGHMETVIKGFHVWFELKTFWKQISVTLKFLLGNISKRSKFSLQEQFFCEKSNG